MSSLKNESLVSSGSLWFPERINKEAGTVDNLYNFILYASLILFVGILAVLWHFVKKYKRTPDNLKAAAHVTENHKLEIVWSVLPLILCGVIFVWGYIGFLKISVPPANAMEIHVVGKKWLWQFEYPNGTKTIGELVVPVNESVKLIMTSEDVIHSFFVPNFRIKRDVIPNRYSRVWFNAVRTGNFQIFCTEFCGDGHSDMLGTVRVLTAEGYRAWLKDANSGSDLPLDQLGEKVYTSKGCNACHSIDGSAKSGPTWKGLFGKLRPCTDGSNNMADENYIKESILKPQSKVVKGFEPVMPTFAGLLNDREIDGVIAYIKKLK